jgi:hypothetical protein
VTIVAAETFTTAHIAVTALITGVLAFVGALLILRRRAPLVESVAIGVLSTLAVFLWRKSANMPQLNTDGLQGFSADDFLAPTITLVVLTVYAAIRQPANMRAFARACAVAVIAVFVVNVVTI